MKNTFVTGANGLLGSFICRELLRNGYHVKALYRESSDLSNLSDIQDRIEWVKGDIFDVFWLESILKDIDALVHAAGMVSYNASDFREMHKTNVEGTANVVNASIAAGVGKIVHISSVAAIGKDKIREYLDEDAKWVNGKHNTSYAKSKYLGELEVWRGFMEGLNGVILNPSVVLGPGKWDRSSPRIFKYVWDQNLFVTKGAINYVDVRDFAVIVSHLLGSGHNHERFIINAGNISYQKFFSKIGQLFAKRAPGIKIGASTLRAGSIFDGIIAKVTGKGQKIPRDLRRVLTSSNFYSNEKIKAACQFEFRDLDDTLQWSCQKIMDKYYIKSRGNC